MCNTYPIKNILKQNTMVIALVALMLLFHALISAAGSGSLFAPTNISNIISQNSYVVILAAGMLLCILSGGNIDLSIGSIVALVGALAAYLIIILKWNIYAVMILCLLTGIAIGAWHGFWIAYVRIPSFIVTLAGMLLWRGVALIILDGLTISPFPEEYLRYFTGFIPAVKDKNLVFTITVGTAVLCCTAFILKEVVQRIHKKRKQYSTENIALFLLRIGVICFAVLFLAVLLGKHKGIPVILILLAVVVAAYTYITRYTVPGRYLYAMGGNERAAKLSGVNTNKVLFSVYVNMGFLSALAALVCVGRFNSAAPTAGMNYELDAIGSCFIGGASAYGGTGTVGGAVVGAIFMGVLNNGMSILGIDSNWQKAVKGLVLLAAVAFDVLSKRREKQG